MFNINNSIWSTELDWEDNSFVRIDLQGKIAVKISANKEGLISLAKHLLALADSEKESVIYETDPGDLEEGSLCLEISRVICDGRRS